MAHFSKYTLVIMSPSLHRLLSLQGASMNFTNVGGELKRNERVDKDEVISKEGCRLSVPVQRGLKKQGDTAGRANTPKPLPYGGFEVQESVKWPHLGRLVEQ